MGRKRGGRRGEFCTPADGGQKYFTSFSLYYAFLRVGSVVLSGRWIRRVVRGVLDGLWIVVSIVALLPWRCGLEVGTTRSS
jgi:hypothetical protein